MLKYQLNFGSLVDSLTVISSCWASSFILKIFNLAASAILVTYIKPSYDGLNKRDELLIF